MSIIALSGEVIGYDEQLDRLCMRISDAFIHGGWTMRDDGNAHYFLTKKGTRSLCRRFTRPLLPDHDFINADPLALENCQSCRRRFLKIKGLI